MNNNEKCIVWHEVVRRTMRYKVTEAPSYYHCCSVKAISFVIWVCVWSLR